jgi:hypothetical protein
MKTERKHELQKNELADVLGHELDYLRPYLKIILAVVVAVVAISVTIAVLSGQRASKNTAAWSSFYQVIGESGSDSERLSKQLDSVAKANAGTSAGLWSELAAADFKLQSGIRQMFDDRSEAERNLEEAQKHFESVIKGGESQPMLVRRAKLGLAETLEAKNEPDEAEKIYQELVDKNKDDVFGKTAAERLAQVKRLSEAQWYAWFAKYKPAPPGDPFKGRVPGDMSDLPGMNDLKAPGIIGSELDDINKTDSPIEFDFPKRKPTLPEETPDESKPEESKPEEKPAPEKSPEEPGTDKGSDAKEP